MPTPRDEIWVIDDDRGMLSVVATMLSSEGWSVRTFNSPTACLAAAAKSAPRLAIIDLMMPEMSGFDLMERLRRVPDFESIPFLTFTALTDDDNLARAFEAGADDFIRKPFNNIELFERVRVQLRSQALVHKLTRATRDATFLFDLSRTINSSLDTDEVLGALVQRTAEVLEVDRCSIILLERTGDSYGGRLLAASDDEGLTDLAIEVDDYPEIQRLIETQQPVLIEDAQHAPLLATVPHIRELGIRAMALLPMVFRSELVGVLFLKTFSEATLLGEPDIELAVATANIAAIAIHNAGMFEHLKQDRQRLDQALKELQQTKDFLSNLIDSSVDAIVASDMSGLIMVYNKAAERILGYSRGEVLGKLRAEELYDGVGARSVMRLLRSSEQGGVGRIELYQTSLRTKTGGVVPVSLSAAIVEDRGVETATVGIFTDLRERLRMREELARANEDLEHSRRAVVAAELAGAAAHQLNQPLTSILGYAELVKMSLDEAQLDHDTLDKLVEQTLRMARIVKRIGQITQYRTEQYAGDTRIVDLSSGEFSTLGRGATADSTDERPRSDRGHGKEPSR